MDRADWCIVHEIMKELESSWLEHLCFTFNGSSGKGSDYLEEFSSSIFKLESFQDWSFG